MESCLNCPADCVCPPADAGSDGVDGPADAGGEGVDAPADAGGSGLDGRAEAGADEGPVDATVSPPDGLEDAARPDSPADGMSDGAGQAPGFFGQPARPACGCRVGVEPAAPTGLLVLMLGLHRRRRRRVTPKRW
jgi:MYXO-CTERM domain-containing protein